MARCAICASLARDTLFMRSRVASTRCGESENCVDALPVRSVHGGAATRKRVGPPRQKIDRERRDDQHCKQVDSNVTNELRTAFHIGKNAVVHGDRALLS
ncbi:MAG TPA: hypothetical protein VNT02_03760 [Burkholderiales bacterium]|nr:hypothetical protein [Burkholderiales bacterium]